MLENFFRIVTDNLKEITGTIDVTNIVANVANSFGVTNAAKYIDGDVSTDLLDVTTDATAEAATESLTDGVTEVVGMIFDFLG